MIEEEEQSTLKMRTEIQALVLTTQRSPVPLTRSRLFGVNSRQNGVSRVGGSTRPICIAEKKRKIGDELECYVPGVPI